MPARMMNLVETIFDMGAIQLFRERAKRLNVNGADFLLQRAVDDMADRLDFVDRTFENAAITSGNADLIASNFLQSTRHENAIFAINQRDRANTTHQSEEFLPGHYQDLDLALSFLSLHQTNDTPGALVQIRQSLKPDGLFMGVMAGSETLPELRQSLLEAETELCGGASPRVYPFADVRSVGALLQRAGFALPVVDSETITVRYADIFALIRDLRSMGAGNGLMNRSRKPLKRSVLFRAAKIYQEKYAQSDGKIPATFTFIWMSGWAPSASQPKPAKRGSATVSLNEALRKIES
jgi:SAM-dependent methyltransferase